MARSREETSMSIFIATLFGPVLEREVDPGSAECRLVQRNWGYHRFKFGCRRMYWPISKLIRLTLGCYSACTLQILKSFGHLDS